MLNSRFCAHLIATVLEGTPFPAPEKALPLLLGTIATESLFRYRRQVGGGPALGYAQIEPGTEQDCWRNWIAYRPEMQRLFAERCGLVRPSVQALEYDLVYGVLLARVIYRRASAPLPEPGDLVGQSEYYKQWYNTPSGKGTPEQYRERWAQLVAPYWRIRSGGTP